MTTSGNTITVVERENGWRDITRHRMYDSAGAALKAVKAYAKRRGVGCVQIQWKPRTDAGTAAVRVLGGA